MKYRDQTKMDHSKESEPIYLKLGLYAVWLLLGISILMLADTKFGLF